MYVILIQREQFNLQMLLYLRGIRSAYIFVCKEVVEFRRTHLGGHDASVGIGIMGGTRSGHSN